MPKKKIGDKYVKKYSEENIQAALEAIVQNKMTKHKAAKEFGVPRSTLQFRLSSRFTKTSHGPNPVLHEQEESMLVNWMLDCRKKGFSYRKVDVQASVKHFLEIKPRENPFLNNLPGDGWYRNFLRRHSYLLEKPEEDVIIIGSNSVETNVRKWFIQVQKYLEDENLFHILNNPTRVYNGDETYFSVCPKSKQITGPKNYSRYVGESDEDTSKSNLTIFFMFSANGDITPPYIVYPYLRLPQTIGSSAPDFWGVGASESGWITPELFIKYIKNVFYPHLMRSQVTLPVIVFVDGFASHITFEVTELCNQLKIILIKLYPNAIRFLGPADLSAFKPIKSVWSNAYAEWKRLNPNLVLTLTNVIFVLNIIYDKFMLKPETLQNGFQKSGLFPWNVDVIEFQKYSGYTRRKTVSPTRPNYEHTISLPFSVFSNIAGENLMNSFEQNGEQMLSFHEAGTLYQKMYLLYCKFKSDNNTLTCSSKNPPKNKRFKV